MTGTRLLLTTLVLSLIFNTAYSQRKGYWQQHVDYKIAVDVDEINYQYNGNMTLKYANNSGLDLSKVYFHLYFNAFQPGSMMDHRLQNIVDPDQRMVLNEGTRTNPVFKSRISVLQPEEIGYQKINTLTFNGQPVEFNVEGTVMEVILPTALKDGEVGVFDMTWDAQVPEQIRRSGRNSQEGVALSMTQWYPKMAHFDEFGWHLDEYVAREFIAPFGDFDVTINIHKDYVIGSSGVLQNPQEVKGYTNNPEIKTTNNKASWHYIAKNIHDFAWAADPKLVVDSVKSKGGVSIYGVYLPTNEEVVSNWTTALSLAADFFDLTGERFGAYPWPTYTIAQGGDGGMEYGTATLITGGRNLRGLVGVIFHEAAHSWYQHLFGINETVDEWFDEGFTSYLQSIAMGALFEQRTNTPETNPVLSSYIGYNRLAKSGREEPMSLLADYYKTNYAYSAASYTKGAVFAHQLGYIIGQENLDATFLRFYELWKFKHPTPNDFKRVAEDVSGINLKWYFNLFLNTTRTIDYAVKAVNSTELTLVNKSDIAMPIDLLVTYEDDTQELFYIPLREMRGKKPEEKTFELYGGIKRTVLENWFWTKPEYTIKLEKNVKNAVIDPSTRLADVEPEDNTLVL